MLSYSGYNIIRNMRSPNSMPQKQTFISFHTYDDYCVWYMWFFLILTLLRVNILIRKWSEKIQKKKICLVYYSIYHGYIHN